MTTPPARAQPPPPVLANPPCCRSSSCPGCDGAGCRPRTNSAVIGAFNGAPICGPDHELHNVAGFDPADLNRSADETIDQEVAHPHPARGADSWRQSTDGIQMRMEALQFVLDCLRKQRLRSRNTAYSPSYTQQMRQRTATAAVGNRRPAKADCQSAAD